MKKAILIIQWDDEDYGYRDTLPTIKQIVVNENYDVCSDLDYYTDHYGCLAVDCEIITEDEDEYYEYGLDK